MVASRTHRSTYTISRKNRGLSTVVSWEEFVLFVPEAINVTFNSQSGPLSLTNSWMQSLRFLDRVPHRCKREGSGVDNESIITSRLEVSQPRSQAQTLPPFVVGSPNCYVAPIVGRSHETNVLKEMSLGLAALCLLTPISCFMAFLAQIISIRPVLIWETESRELILKKFKTSDNKL